MGAGRGRSPRQIDQGTRSRPASTSSTPPTSTPPAAARRSPAARCGSYADREDVVLATKVHGRMRPGPERRRPVPQGDPARDRRQPDPARHRLRRPLPDPPLGPGDADRGDDGGAARRGEGRQGALPRRVVDVRLAVRQGAARRRAARLDAVRLDAEPLQPDLPRGGAGDAAALRGPGRRRHPVEPAGPRPADPRLGHRRPRAPRPTSSARTLYRDEDRAVVEHGRSRSPSGAASPPAQVALAWLLAQPAVTSPIVGVTKPRAPRRRRRRRRPRARPTTSSRSSAPATCRTPSPATAEGRPYSRILAHTPAHSAIVRLVCRASC